MSQFPVIPAGQAITASLLMSMLPNMVVKQANTDRTNNTFAADPELTFNLVAGGSYFVEFFLLLGGTTTGDIQTRWAVPSGSSGLRSVIGPSSVAADANADNITTRQGSHLFGTGTLYSGVRNATGQVFQAYEWGVLLSSGSGGAISLEWAQGTTNASASRVNAGSLLRVTRIS